MGGDKYPYPFYLTEIIIHYITVSKEIIMSKRTLKVFGIILASYRDDRMQEHYPDMPDHVRQVRAIVATKTKKEAQELFGVTSGEMNNFSGETGNEFELATALAKPGQVFARPVNKFNDTPFVEITRKAHVPMKRRPRPVWTPPVPKPAFTKEELETIFARFEMSNDPDSIAVRDKAAAILRAI